MPGIRKITKFTLPVLVLACLATSIATVSPIISTTKVYAASPATQANPADSAATAHCKGQQAAIVIPSGPNRGKWYCKNVTQQGGGQAQGQGDINPDASGCKGDSSQCGGTCGSGDSAYTPVIDIGCQGKGNPIMDSLFGIIRYLSDGVGLVVVGSIIVGGIQYSASRGDPQATALAINRIRSSLIALLIYIFAYAFLNYLLPGFVL